MAHIGSGWDSVCAVSLLALDEAPTITIFIYMFQMRREAFSQITGTKLQVRVEGVPNRTSVEQFAGSAWLASSLCFRLPISLGLYL